jgi:hypothetical protein
MGKWRAMGFEPACTDGSIAGPLAQLWLRDATRASASRASAIGMGKQPYMGGIQSQLLQEHR